MNNPCQGKYCPNCITRHCKNGMQDCRFSTDYRPNCETNEQLFARYNIPVGNGSHFRIFLQKHGCQVLNGLRQDFAKRTKFENPTGCNCVYYDPKTNKPIQLQSFTANPLNPREVLDVYQFARFPRAIDLPNSASSTVFVDKSKQTRSTRNASCYPFKPAVFNCKSYAM